MMEVIARHHETGRWVRGKVAGGIFSSVEPAEGPEDLSAEDDWIAPAFVDIQNNGRWGISFSDPTLTVDQVAAIARAQGALGTARFCPTLITASQDALLHGVRTIAAACERFPDVARAVLGIHLEGPCISDLEGYRGAHPVEHVRDPDWDEFEALQEAGGGRIVLVTLAPERRGGIEFIRRLRTVGVVVALGHTSADGPTLAAAAEAGATISTHLGNGIAAMLPRHPNPIWHQAADDRLAASLIADDHHLDPATLRVLARAKGADRLVLVSDASPLADAPPGLYGPLEVLASGKIVVAGTPYLAGANQGLAVGVSNLILHGGLTLRQSLAAATSNPAALLGRASPRIAAGVAADFLLGRFLGMNLPSVSGRLFHLRATFLVGRPQETY
jgi:N-acetylglucosamine-6-phosphate deacetylase